LLWDIYSTTHIPEKPSATTIAQFNSRYASPDDVEALLNTDPLPITDLVRARVRQVRLNVNQTRNERGQPSLSLIQKRLAMIQDPDLEQIFAYLVKVGLNTWQPDVLEGTPETLYNLAHRSTAIKTFQIAAGNLFVYRFMEPNLVHLRDMQIMEKVYNHIVWWYLRNRARMEAKTAGSIMLASQMATIYSRCKDVGILVGDICSVC
jgi:hypothetical protein